MNYIVKLMRKGKDADVVVAEMDVEGSQEGPQATANHYAKHARVFMRHVRFDYAVAEPLK